MRSYNSCRRHFNQHEQRYPTVGLGSPLRRSCRNLETLDHRTMNVITFVCSMDRTQRPIHGVCFLFTCQCQLWGCFREATQQVRSQSSNRTRSAPNIFSARKRNFWAFRHRLIANDNHSHDFQAEDDVHAQVVLLAPKRT